MMKPVGMYAVRRDPTQYKVAHMVVSATSLLVALISITIEQFPTPGLSFAFKGFNTP